MGKKRTLDVVAFYEKYKGKLRKQTPFLYAETESDGKTRMYPVMFNDTTVICGHCGARGLKPGSLEQHWRNKKLCQNNGTIKVQAQMEYSSRKLNEAIAVFDGGSRQAEIDTAVAIFKATLERDLPEEEEEEENAPQQESETDNSDLPEEEEAAEKENAPQEESDSSEKEADEVEAEAGDERAEIRCQLIDETNLPQLKTDPRAGGQQWVM